MKVQNIEIQNIKPYEKNPRHNERAIEKVMQSIKDFGFKVPLVIDKDNVIITGHTRYEACKRLGIDKIPCVIATDLTEKQVKAFRLVDNRVSEFSEWDFATLQEELEGCDDLDVYEFKTFDTDKSYYNYFSEEDKQDFLNYIPDGSADDDEESTEANKKFPFFKVVWKDEEQKQRLLNYMNRNGYIYEIKGK